MTTPSYANENVPLSLRLAAAETAARNGDQIAAQWAMKWKSDMAATATAHSGIDPASACGLTADGHGGSGQIGGPDSAARQAIQNTEASVQNRVFGFLDAVRSPDMPSVVPGSPVVDLTTGGAAFESYAGQIEANRAAAFSDRPGPTHGTYGDPNPQVRKAEAEGRWEDAFGLKFGQFDD